MLTCAVLGSGNTTQSKKKKPQIDELLSTASKWKAQTEMNQIFKKALE